MLSGQEVRRKLMEGLKEQRSRQPKSQSPEFVHKAKEAAEAMREMMHIGGWKLVEGWIDRQIEDVALRSILGDEQDIERKAVAKAYAHLLLWVNEVAQYKPPMEEDNE